MSKSFTLSADQLEYLASPAAVRERSQQLFELAQAGKTHFKLNLARLPAATDLTYAVTRESYPGGAIPFHARWEHFQVGGVDRIGELNQALAPMDRLDRARAKLDLAIVSVLLDAGAGAQWKYTESGREYSRSEGLAVASFRLFQSGAFSSKKSSPWRADAAGLERLTLSELEQGFQVSESNPVVGLEGRLRLLKNLGRACQANPGFFASGSEPRPGGLVDYYLAQAKKLSAPVILKSLLMGLAEVWPERTRINGVNFGDLWTHSLLTDLEGLIPFHKLSQWLTYSLIEPIQEAGIDVVDVHRLTGLPEYRNGGLFVDLGIMELRDPALARKPHRPESEILIEWRALTIVLLDRLAAQLREKLGKTEIDLPLAKVLQGGTWTAGRKIAKELRPDGSPPFQIESDGTVF